jgi:hypothetical protein
MIALSTLSLALGALIAAVQLFALAKPKQFAEGLRAFPRSATWGYVLMLGSAAVFLMFLRNETLADFERLKPALMVVFAAASVGICVYVRDFLAVRGLALAAMILAKVMVDVSRPHLAESRWVLVIPVWAYLLVAVGMWLTVSPWRLRDMIVWATANEGRVRLLAAARLAFGLAMVLLGLTVY